MTINTNNIEYSKLKDVINQHATLKECVLKESSLLCKGKIKCAHSLQRMGSLSLLASLVNKNLCVYTLTEKEFDSQTGYLKIVPIGKKAASTFFGFCDIHDTEIFKPIEQNPNSVDLNSIEHCFLLSFRAFSISYHRKKECINLLNKKDTEIKPLLIKYFNNDNLDDQLKGYELGLNDLKPYQEILVNSIQNKNYTSLKYFTYQLDYTSPVAVSMMTSPPFLFSGKELNTSTNPDFQFSDILTSIIPLKYKTLIVLAAFKEDPHGLDYLNEFQNMKDEERQKALTWHILTNAENIFFSPQWFDSLNPQKQQFILQLSDFVDDINTPYLKFNKNEVTLNFFDVENSLK